MYNVMKKLGRAEAIIVDVFSIICFVGVVVLMMLNVVDVIGTKFLSMPIKGAYEITEQVLLCTVFSAFAYGQIKHTHINMTLIIGRFPGVSKFIPYIIGGILSVFTAALVGYCAIIQGMGSNTLTGVLHIPLKPFYFVEAISMFVFALTLLYDTVMGVCSLFDKQCAEELTKDWD